MPKVHFRNIKVLGWRLPLSLHAFLRDQDYCLLQQQEQGQGRPSKDKWLNLYPSGKYMSGTFSMFIRIQGFQSKTGRIGKVIGNTRFSSPS